MGKLKLLKTGSGIHIKKSHEGLFTSYCGGKVTQDKINKAKHSSNPKIRKLAIFAENARKWKHENGGRLSYSPDYTRGLLVALGVQSYGIGGLFGNIWTDVKDNVADWVDKAKDTTEKVTNFYKDVDDKVKEKTGGLESLGGIVKKGLGTAADILNKYNRLKNLYKANQLAAKKARAEGRVDILQGKDAELSAEQEKYNENIDSGLSNILSTDTVNKYLSGLHFDNVKLAGGSNAALEAGNAAVAEANLEFYLNKADVELEKIDARLLQRDTEAAQKTTLEAVTQKELPAEEKKDGESEVGRTQPVESVATNLNDPSTWGTNVLGNENEIVVTPDSSTIGKAEKLEHNPNGANVETLLPSENPLNVNGAAVVLDLSKNPNGNPSGDSTAQINAENNQLLINGTEGAQINLQAYRNLYNRISASIERLQKEKKEAEANGTWSTEDEEYYKADLEDYNKRLAKVLGLMEAKRNGGAIPYNKNTFKGNIKNIL